MYTYIFRLWRYVCVNCTHLAVKTSDNRKSTKCEQNSKGCISRTYLHESWRKGGGGRWFRIKFGWFYLTSNTRMNWNEIHINKISEKHLYKWNDMNFRQTYSSKQHTNTNTYTHTDRYIHVDYMKKRKTLQKVIFHSDEFGINNIKNTDNFEQ